MKLTKSIGNAADKTIEQKQKSICVLQWLQRKISSDGPIHEIFARLLGNRSRAREANFD